MKLALLCFDDMITVPGGKIAGERTTADVCESQFRSVDGWDLREITLGVFTLQSACMPEPMTVGGHGYRYIPEVAEPAPPPEPKGKKR